MSKFDEIFDGSDAHLIPQNIESEILEWSRKTFPNATRTAYLRKLQEECMELMMAIECDDDQQILEEAADVFIVATSFAANRETFEGNVLLSRVIADKMAVNKARVWGDKEDENGDRPRQKC